MTDQGLELRIGDDLDWDNELLCPLSCELCQREFAIIFAQHKGVTYVNVAEVTPVVCIYKWRDDDEPESWNRYEWNEKKEEAYPPNSHTHSCTSDSEWHGSEHICACHAYKNRGGRLDG